MFSADVARTMSPSVRSTSDDGRYSLIATGTPGLVERAIDDRESAAADLPVDPIVQQLIPAGEGLVGDGHGRRWMEVIRANSLAIRMPKRARALAPAADNAYILRMNAPKVKPEKLPESGRFRR